MKILIKYLYKTKTLAKANCNSYKCSYHQNIIFPLINQTFGPKEPYFFFATNNVITNADGQNNLM